MEGMLGIPKFLCEAARAETATSTRRNSFPIIDDGNARRKPHAILCPDIGRCRCCNGGTRAGCDSRSQGHVVGLIIFGGHAHHPGVSGDSPPRVRDIEMTLLVEGQDGRLAWGRSSSANADTKEPFAWAMSSAILAPSADGRHLSPDQFSS